MESTRVEKLQPQNIPHGEIWPPKITGKIRFFAENCPEKVFFAGFLISENHFPNRNLLEASANPCSDALI
jgi:hypothetical protein